MSSISNQLVSKLNSSMTSIRKDNNFRTEVNNITGLAFSKICVLIYNSTIIPSFVGITLGFGINFFKWGAFNPIDNETSEKKTPYRLNKINELFMITSLTIGTLSIFLKKSSQISCLSKTFAIGSIVLILANTLGGGSSNLSSQSEAPSSNFFASFKNKIEELLDRSFLNSFNLSSWLNIPAKKPIQVPFYGAIREYSVKNIGIMLTGSVMALLPKTHNYIFPLHLLTGTVLGMGLNLLEEKTWLHRFWFVNSIISCLVMGILNNISQFFLQNSMIGKMVTLSGYTAVTLNALYSKKIETENKEKNTTSSIYDFKLPEKRTIGIGIVAATIQLVTAIFFTQKKFLLIEI